MKIPSWVGLIGRRVAVAKAVGARERPLGPRDIESHGILSRASEEAAHAASSALAIVDTAERLLDRDLEASDDAGVSASRE
jgi:hypothetical protein